MYVGHSGGYYECSLFMFIIPKLGVMRYVVLAHFNVYWFDSRVGCIKVCLSNYLSYFNRLGQHIVGFISGSCCLLRWEGFGGRWFSKFQLFNMGEVFDSYQVYLLHACMSI